MKTFFDIEITGLGEDTTIRLQSTKLRKAGENERYGVYIPKATITCNSYVVDIKLYLTYSVEMGGTIEKIKRQKRYTLHRFEYSLYQFDRNGMLHNQPNSLAKISVTMEEIDVEPFSCMISVFNR